MNKYNITKLVYEIGEDDLVVDAHCKQLTIEAADFESAVRQDLTTQIQTDPLLKESTDTPQTIEEHIDEFLFITEEENIAIYDGSEGVQISYISHEKNNLQ